MKGLSVEKEPKTGQKTSKPHDSKHVGVHVRSALFGRSSELFAFFFCREMVGFIWRGEGLTLGDDPLEADDVVVAELAHDAGFAQEVHPLLLRVAHLQGLDGHRHLLLATFQGALVDLPEFACPKDGGGSKPVPFLPSPAQGQAGDRAPWGPTGADDLLAGDGGRRDLGGEFEHGLVGVLIGVRVHVGLEWLQLVCWGGAGAVSPPTCPHHPTCATTEPPPQAHHPGAHQTWRSRRPRGTGVTASSSSCRKAVFCPKTHLSGGKNWDFFFFF